MMSMEDWGMHFLCHTLSGRRSVVIYSSCGWSCSPRPFPLMHLSCFNSHCNIYQGLKINCHSTGNVFHQAWRSAVSQSVMALLLWLVTFPTRRATQAGECQWIREFFMEIMFCILATETWCGHCDVLKLISCDEQDWLGIVASSS